jgi:hypothetical protein
MKTQPHLDTPTVFPQTLPLALARLKRRLRRDYQQAYPQLAEIVHLVLDEEEARAWELSEFPHLLLPDLVEAHVAKLNLKPANTRREMVPVPRDFVDIADYQPAFAMCG